MHGINGETQCNRQWTINVKEKRKIEGEEDENKTEKWRKHKTRKEPYQTVRDHGLMALDTIMVELQRCVKKSMAAEIGWRNGGMFWRHLQAMESEGGERIS